MATVLKQNSDTRELPGASHGAPSAPPEAPKGSRRRVVLPIVLVLVALGALWAYKQWSYGRAHESTDDAAVDGHLVPVLAKVSGYVQTVNVSDNDHVKADSLLVQIDPSEYRVRVAQSEADLAAARASAGGAGSAGQAQAMVEQASGQRASLDAQITAAKANETKARQDLARAEELAGKQIVSKMQLDAARAAADAASANVVALQRQTSAAGGTVASAEAGVRLATARLQGAQAARDNAALQLSYTHVTAPASGIVSRKQVEPGQLIQAGQPLLTIVADTGIYVTANFKETQLGDLRVGQQVGDRSRCVRRRGCDRMCRKFERRDRIEVRAPAAGQRDGQLHESRTARARANPRHQRSRAEPSVAPRDVGHGARRDDGAGRTLLRQRTKAECSMLAPVSRDD